MMLETATLLRPVPGYYKMRLAKKAVYSPVRVQLEGERDEVGELIEDERLTITINGEDLTPEQAWAMVERVNVYGVRINKDEYDFRVADFAWTSVHAPDDPVANPGKPVDLSKAKPLF